VRGLIAETAFVLDIRHVMNTMTVVIWTGAEELVVGSFE
jgi:hypothetical protein